MKKAFLRVRVLCALLCILCSLTALFGCVDTAGQTDGAEHDSGSDVLSEQNSAEQTADLPAGSSPADITAPADTTPAQTASGTPTPTPTPTDIEIPEYSGEAYITLLGNQPRFTADDYVTQSYETYGELDSLGRCTQVYACIGRELMPTGDRGSIGTVKPSGWQTAKYDFVDGKYLYNRCHLIGWQLTGENANTKNLITGTRYLNIEGMLPFENMVADYIKETNNHVLYRVTPVFKENDLVARGVMMEGWSVEDNGEGICFFVFSYNVQPGVRINYSDGTNEATAQSEDTSAAETESAITYILNTSSKKFHYPSCRSVKQMADKNKGEFTGARDDLLGIGYDPCGICKP